MCLPGYKTLGDLTNDELHEVSKLYDLGELLSTEEQIEQVMSRIGTRLGYRPVLVRYGNEEIPAEMLAITDSDECF